MRQDLKLLCQKKFISNMQNLYLMFQNSKDW